MTDGEALHAAVVAEPLEDVPRLVYADWLDETGDAVQMARAEFIRLQCELARDSDNVAAVIREHCLHADHAEAWLAPLKARGEPLVSPSSSGRFRRGFVEIVWMRGNVFLEKAEKLFRRCPVLELRITQATPVEMCAIVRHPMLARLQVFEFALAGLADPFVRTAIHTPSVATLRGVSMRNCGLNDDLAMQLADVPFDWPLVRLDVAHNGGPGGLTSVGLSALQRRFGTRAVVSDPRQERKHTPHASR